MLGRIDFLSNPLDACCHEELTRNELEGGQSAKSLGLDVWLEKCSSEMLEVLHMIGKRAVLGSAPLMVVMAACASNIDSGGSAAPMVPAGAATSVPCGKLPGTGENGGPQSRMYKGGKLEFVEYFYGSNGALPSSPLSAPISAHVPRHSDFTVSTQDKGDYEVVVEKNDGTKKALGKVRLYEPMYNGPFGKENLCAGEEYLVLKKGKIVSVPELSGKAIMHDGHWDAESGTYMTEDKEHHKSFVLSCPTGVVAKCMLRGYLPSSQPNLFKTCLYAFRSQINDEVPIQRQALTCNGTTIDIYDNQGIQDFDQDLPATYTFEAAWNTKGMVCSNHPRYAGCKASMDKIPKCPDEVATGNSWSFEGQEILIKTRSAMVEKECPNEDEANVQEICAQ